MTESGPPRSPVNVYAAATLLGIILMAIGIVGGAIVKDISVAATVSTTVPGIGLLLYGIRGSGRDPA